MIAARLEGLQNACRASCIYWITPQERKCNMFFGYYRKSPYNCLRLGPLGGYQGMFAPDWMYERAVQAAVNCEPFNCNCPCNRYCNCCGCCQRLWR